MRCVLCALLVLAAAPWPAVVSPAAASDAARVHVTADSDPEAVALAQKVVEAMGGWEAWDATRYLVWNFFGARRHWWDRFTGDVRIEADDTLLLMNVNTREGRAWKNGEEVTQPDSLAQLLETGHKIWVNDSYWLIMPWKMLDPGVRLRMAGEAELPDGRPADVVEMTFEDGTGYTDRNKYHVFVARDTGLVEQWAFYADRDDPEPRFTLPWADYRRFGKIRIATSHGRDKDWEIAAPDTLPESVFRSPDPVG